MKIKIYFLILRTQLDSPTKINELWTKFAKRLHWKDSKFDHYIKQGTKNPFALKAKAHNLKGQSFEVFSHIFIPI